MEITIKGTEKEIAGLVLELQNQSIYEACRNYLAKEKMS